MIDPNVRIYRVNTLNNRDTLLAYLDGTLSPKKRREVAQKIASSPRWQRDYDSLSEVRFQLKNEMPLIGSPLDGQLASLLPNIFEETQTRFRWKRLMRQTLLYGSVVLTIVALTVGFVELTSSAHASVQTFGNVPSVTNTPVDADSTSEAKVQVWSVQVAEAEAEDNVKVSLFASPVPMPMATVEPSLEAGGGQIVEQE